MQSTSVKATVAGVASLAVLVLGIATATTPASAEAESAGAPDIAVEDVLGHLERLAEIAEEHGGNRTTGEPGHRASVEYLRAELEAAGYETQVEEFQTRQGTAYNLIADLPGGDEDRTLMLGAHLDSVGAGPGINDNGTGSAALLEIAETYAEHDPARTHHVRFAFWGAEELGLIGSRRYVDNLSEEEADQIAAYANADMLGSPNPAYFVYDDNPLGDRLRDDLTGFFAEEGIESAYVDIDGSSDHTAFIRAGIPTAGTFSGAGARKTEQEAELWGGAAGEPYDSCYHRACDDLGNVDTGALDVHTDVLADALWQWSSGPTIQR